MFKKPQVRIFSSFIFLLIYILIFPVPQKVYGLRGMGISGSDDVLIYTTEKTGDSVYTGDYYEVRTTVKDLKSTKDKTFISEFITVIFEGDSGHVLRELNIKNAKVSQINGGTLYTGFSQRIQGRTVLSGSVNVQVYCKDNIIFIGTPTIYGSY